MNTFAYMIEEMSHGMPLTEIAARYLPIECPPEGCSHRDAFKPVTSPFQTKQIEKHLKAFSITKQSALEAMRGIMQDAAFHSGLGPQSAVERGKNWYFVANQLASDLANEYGTTTEIVAGVIAATSPKTRFATKAEGGPYHEMMKGTNVSAAKSILKAVFSDKDTTFQIPPGTIGLEPGPYKLKDIPSDVLAKLYPGFRGFMRGFIVKGVRIARGETSPEAELGGRKTRKFFHNLADPTNSTDATVDTWMMRGFTGDAQLGKAIWKKGSLASTGKASALADKDEMHTERLLGAPRRKTGRSEADKKKFARAYKDWIDGVGSYPFFESVLQQVAHEYGLQPHQAQAIIWEYLKDFWDERRNISVGIMLNPTHDDLAEIRNVVGKYPSNLDDKAVLRKFDIEKLAHSKGLKLAVSIQQTWEKAIIRVYRDVHKQRKDPFAQPNLFKTGDNMKLTQYIEAVRDGQDPRDVARGLVDSVTVVEADRLMGDEGTVKTSGGVTTMKKLTTDPDKPKPKPREGKGVADESAEEGVSEDNLDELGVVGKVGLGAAAAVGGGLLARKMWKNRQVKKTTVKTAGAN